PAVEIEAAREAVAKLLGQLLPAWRELARPADDPRHVVGIVSTAQVGAGVAESAQHRNRAGGALEPGTEPAVLRSRFFANDVQELRRDPASGRLPPRHPLGGAGTEDVDVAEQRCPEAALVDVALQLPELLRVPPDLSDGAVGARGDFLLELEI